MSTSFTCFPFMSLLPTTSAKTMLLGSEERLCRQVLVFIGQVCILPCRAGVEAAVSEVLGAAADSSQPLMDAGLDSLGELPSRACFCTSIGFGVLDCNTLASLLRGKSYKSGCVSRCCGAPKYTDCEFRNRAASHRHSRLPYCRCTGTAHCQLGCSNITSKYRFGRSQHSRSLQTYPTSQAAIQSVKRRW